MRWPLDRPVSRNRLIGMILVVLVATGCSERPTTKTKPGSQATSFRKIRFANDWVVVPFRSGLVTTTTVPKPAPGFVPIPGERVTLSDAGDGEVFVAADLESLQFYHSSPGPEQLHQFETLAEAGKLFIVARGTTAIVAKVVQGQLPDGLRACELRLLGENGGTAWVSDAFLRRTAEAEKHP